MNSIKRWFKEHVCLASSDKRLLIIQRNPVVVLLNAGWGEGRIFARVCGKTLLILSKNHIMICGLELWVTKQQLTR